MSHEFSRRSLLRGLAATTATTATAAATAVALPAATAGAQSQPTGDLPFLHGVASGDPLPTSVILWTRVTPDRDALPGSTLGAATAVRWELTADRAFTAVVASGEATTSAESDHTLHIDAGGLQPGTEYYYRFTVTDGPHAGAVSPIGRTKTAPAQDADVDKLNFALASCANWEAGYFSAYRHMADHGADLDFVAFLGDYIYEYGTGEYAGKHGVVRACHPEREILTLEDYRIRYGQYRTDHNLQDAHAAAPWIVMWDDHETANNSWRGGAENHDTGEGSWDARRAAAMQAYFEWQPMRRTTTSEQGRLYRTFTFGNLAELTMMDLRTYRDAETSTANFGDPDRAMLGAEQFNWVGATVGRSTARWNLLGNSVMVSPFKLLTLPDTPDNRDANEALAFLKQQASGVALNSDQWDGYDAERDRLLKLLADHGSNVLFLTGDIHSEWANSLYHGSKEIGLELVCTSVTSPNVDDLLTQKTGIEHAPNNGTSRLVERLLRDANPWVKHLDFDAHGYTRATLRRDEVRADFVRVANVEHKESATQVAVTKTWRAGEGFVG